MSPSPTCRCCAISASRCRPGASAALIGRNGAGKTTTVRTIMGFTEARGTVRLGGEDLGPLPPHRRPSLGIGYAPEDRRLFSAFTVEENILLPGRVAKLSPARDAAQAGSRLFRASGAEGTCQAAGGIGLRRPGQDGGARPRADAGDSPAHSRRAVPGPRPCAGAALCRSAAAASFAGQGHHAADHGDRIQNFSTASPT